MKSSKILAAAVAMVLLLTACGKGNHTPGREVSTENATEIFLSDDGVRVGGAPAGSDETAAVYTANDIVYYETGKDFTYGEGTEADAHSAEEAAAHTVVHIAQPGVYSISGTLSRGQIAVDLGEGAEDDPDAVVTLILNGADITCEVAPAVIFYRVYECGDGDNASKEVDTSAAGANVIIADGTANTVKGSYVARIYKPGSVVLNDSGTEVEEAKKLHKYDGAFYSKMSMNVDGGKEGTGVLNIYAENEGLDSELHLTVNGGNIHIFSGNDGINTNEDGVSVTTVNGGVLNIEVTGETGEGDGIDSNGWLVINGGTVIASACSHSADAGIDSDMGIHINGGTVIAGGHMLDRIEEGGQTYAVFNFAAAQKGVSTVCLKNEKGKTVVELCPQNDFSVLIYSGPELKEGTYTLWSNGVQMAGQGGGMVGGPGMPGVMPGGMEPPQGERPEGMGPGEGAAPPEGEPPEGMDPGAGGARPGGEAPERPGGGSREPNDRGQGGTQELTAEVRISAGGNMFSGIKSLE